VNYEIIAITLCLTHRRHCLKAFNALQWYFRHILAYIQTRIALFKKSYRSDTI